VDVYLLASSTRDFAEYSAWGNAKTDRRGRFTFRRSIRRTVYLAAYLDSYFYDSCDPALGAAPCTRGTISPPPEAEVRVLVP
jgi:hypothetical protein